ncbi:hypothetical protein HPB50_010246 [Hyalomma asiaticum]|uniref:Uncharacterized protein n=1 Tax=Hyalomma asiaticum TaxID=266040 RepID=A0ACB7SCF5_HYAAI|nr:hypothetical protein HPB50_010246 [Hyalomma asiaticum]
MVETLNSGLPAGKGPYSVKQKERQLTLQPPWMEIPQWRPKHGLPNPNTNSMNGSTSSSTDFSTSTKKKSKKRPASAMLHDLVALHEKAEERAAKAASDSLQLKKELVALQRESNELQKGMLEMMNTVEKVVAENPNDVPAVYPCHTGRLTSVKHDGR